MTFQLLPKSETRCAADSRLPDRLKDTPTLALRSQVAGLAFEPTTFRPPPLQQERIQPTNGSDCGRSNA
jgi:hypothetical protein